VTGRLTITTARALDDCFLRDYPREAARELEVLPVEQGGEVLARQPLAVLVRIWEHLLPEAGERLLPELGEDRAAELLAELEPATAAKVLIRLQPGRRDAYLGRLAKATANELRRLLDYPADAAGALMDPRPAVFRGEQTADEALQALRSRRRGAVRSVFLVDESNRLRAAVDIQELALADAGRALEELARPVPVTVNALDPREVVTDTLEQHRLEELAVVDIHHRLVGVIHARALMRALQVETSADVQTMVGVSKDERALSAVGFSVRKRLPWMQINLATAFVAAAVVGLFEATIAEFTALAVLLPVVAGQSGNAGAQALAVTMRGLALREISLRQWIRVMFKELRVGFFNGIAVALTTAAAVYLWSGSVGLGMVIAIAMVISMTIACVSGALVPLALIRLGQDPAQSSSIVLTTITDVAGFMSFLGIATALAALL